MGKITNVRTFFLSTHLSSVRFIMYTVCKCFDLPNCSACLLWEGQSLKWCVGGSNPPCNLHDAHTHTDTHRHTQTHTHTHTHTSVGIYTYIFTCRHTHTHTHTYRDP